MLVRGANQLQLGCDPERSVLVDLPPEVSARAVADLLHLLDQPQFELLIAQRCDEVGLGRADFDRDRDATADRRRIGRRVARRSCGSISTAPDRLRDGLDTAMTAAGYPVALSAAPRARPGGRRRQAPRWSSSPTTPTTTPVLVDDLMRRRIPHLSVLLRDGVGVVGTARPARTVELPALRRPPPDHPRSAVAAPVRPAGQPVRGRRTRGHRPHRRSGTRANRAGQRRSRSAHRRWFTPVAQPDLVDRTVEIHARPVRLRHKEWPAHPLCGCGAHGRRA